MMSGANALLELVMFKLNHFLVFVPVEVQRVFVVEVSVASQASELLQEATGYEIKKNNIHVKHLLIHC